MKLRIKGNSVRFRLTRTEVASVAAHGFIECRTDFGEGHQSLVYALTAGPMKDIQACFSDGRLQISVPRGMLEQWAASDEVGLYGKPAPKEDALSIAIEKDFRCLDRSLAEDDEWDAYPHPSSQGRKE
jgi:hypothetical protein